MISKCSFHFLSSVHVLSGACFGEHEQKLVSDVKFLTRNKTAQLRENENVTRAGMPDARAGKNRFPQRKSERSYIRTERKYPSLSFDSSQHPFFFQIHTSSDLHCHFHWRLFFGGRISSQSFLLIFSSILRQITTYQNAYFLRKLRISNSWKHCADVCKFKC